MHDCWMKWSRRTICSSLSCPSWTAFRNISAAVRLSGMVHIGWPETAGSCPFVVCYIE